MTRHLADRRKPSTGARLKAFLHLARSEGQIWQAIWRQPVPVPVRNRRMVEFLRIARGRQV
ncbi:MAG: hypothetical protein JNN06_10015 [Gemmobacter sp.]|uniref:hypothetical protein n=1 Tax=Gemmobacter sp. TaxID=1898957 RepID=UPI001A57F0CF|nr:hypothetical protein [Gemmobacter sp.]MBL8562604.1 hypothetical protein [Gemmobacter sp.]